MSVDVKICGLSTREAVVAAVEGGARFVGFVFYAPSPRSLTPVEAAPLALDVPPGVIRVGLVVNPEDDLLDSLFAHVALDMVQLHGSESAERVAHIRQRCRRPVMKAIAIAADHDVARARAYEEVTDRLLFDARPPKGAARPGGNALAFDWALIRGSRWRVPWMLAGGLHAGNVAEAVRATDATAVDVSSGVEDALGIKNPDKIRQFLNVVGGLGARGREPSI